MTNSVRHEPEAEQVPSNTATVKSGNSTLNSAIQVIYETHYLTEITQQQLGVKLGHNTQSIITSE